MIQWYRQEKNTGQIQPVSRAEVYDHVRGSYKYPFTALADAEAGKRALLTTQFTWFSPRLEALAHPEVPTYAGRRKAVLERDESLRHARAPRRQPALAE